METIHDLRNEAKGLLENLLLDYSCSPTDEEVLDYIYKVVDNSEWVIYHGKSQKIYEIVFWSDNELLERVISELEAIGYDSFKVSELNKFFSAFAYQTLVCLMQDELEKIIDDMEV